MGNQFQFGKLSTEVRLRVNFKSQALWLLELIFIKESTFSVYNRSYDALSAIIDDLCS